MKTFSISFAIFLILSSSPVTARECNFHFSGKAPVTEKLIDLSIVPFKVKRAIDTEEFLTLLKTFKETDIRVGQETLKLSPLVKRKLVSIEDLNEYLSSKGSLSRIQEKISSNTLKALASADSAKALVDYLRIIKRNGLEKYLPDNYLSHSSIVSRGLVSERNLYRASESELKSVVKNELHYFVDNLKELDQLTEVIDVLKYSDFNSAELNYIMAPLRKLGGEFDNMDFLAGVIERSLKNGRLDINKFVGDHLKITIKLMSADIEDGSFDPLLSKIKSGYNFSLAVKRVAGLKKINPFFYWDELSKSHFGRVNGLDKETLKKVYKELVNLKDVTLEDVVRAIENQRPHLARSGKLLSLDNYDKSIKVTAIKDQCSFGACWMQAGVSRHELRLKPEHGDDFELSTDYLYSKYLSDEYKRVLREPDPSYDLVQEGGASEVVPDLIRRYGVVPKVRMKGSEIEGLDASLFESSKVETIRAEITELFARARGTIQKDENTLKNFEKEVDAIMARHTNISQDVTFNFNGTSHTPDSFAQKYVTEAIGSKYEGMAPTDKLKFWDGKFKGQATDEYESIGFDIRKASPEEIEETIKQSISEGRPVQFTAKWPDDEKLLNNHTGMMRGDVFSLKEKLFETTAVHAVLIVGYELNHTGRIQTYKILNSFGTSKGDSGIYHMDKSFFEKFIYWIGVDQYTGLGMVD